MCRTGKGFSKLDRETKIRLTHVLRKPKLKKLLKKSFEDFMDAKLLHCDRNTVLKIQSENLKNTEKKLYKCKYCEKTYDKKCFITQHERIHTRERPFKCETCEKKFRLKPTWMVHKKVHTGQAFECHYCKRDFLKTDEMIRKNATPYKCKPCTRRVILSRRAVISQWKKIDEEQDDPNFGPESPTETMKTYIASKFIIIDW